MNEPSIIHRHRLPQRQRLIAAAGALLAAGAVALAAYASHGAEGLAQARLQLAAAFAFGHGLALHVLAPRAVARLARIALAAMLVGTLLFAGSIAVAALSEFRAVLAPFGGMLLIAAWLACVAVSLRD